jgi:hypothetical protein
MRIEAGRPYSARYRFVVADGPANKALLERLWRDFAARAGGEGGTPASALHR